MKDTDAKKGTDTIIKTPNANRKGKINGILSVSEAYFYL